MTASCWRPLTSEPWTDFARIARVLLLIPALNELGYLPPGVHVATLDEVIARFGVGNEQRQAQAESLDWLLPVCCLAGISRMLINGSFVTARDEPMDVDIALLQGAAYSAMSNSAGEIRQGFPFLDIKVVNEEDYSFFINSIFVRDRSRVSKGVIEVVL